VAALTRPCGVLLFVCEEEEAGAMSIRMCLSPTDPMIIGTGWV